MLAGICNRASQGGGLGRQVEELLKRAGAESAIPVAVRYTAFPTNPKTAIGQLLRDLLEGGGRRVVVEDSDWRTMTALARFKNERGAIPALRVWQKLTKPLSGLSALCAILRLDETIPEAQAPLTSTASAS
jgi:hypothetical protein